MPTRRALAAAPLLPILQLASSRAAPAIPAAARPISRLDLAWWRRRHAEKLMERASRPVRLVFLGDSITQRYEIAGPPAWHDWHAVWTRFYGDRDALNLGFSGDATCHLLWRIENGEIDRIAARAAVILIGANNFGRLHWSAADTVAGIDAVVAATRQRLPQAGILLLGVLPSDRGDWVRQATDTVNASLAARYGAGQVAGVQFRDCTSLFLRNGRIDTRLYADPKMVPPEVSLHPDAVGQSHLAAAIEPVIASLMGDRIHAG